MWTPRRIFLLVIGLLLCGGAYTVYAQFLGWVDGLPPLPDRYRQVATDPVKLPEVSEVEGNPTLRRIQEAFGRNCEEIQPHYKIKIDNRARGVLLVAGEFSLEPDGRVQLTPCSVAVFGKPRGPKETVPEINTVHCDRAFIEFDQPVRKITEMDGRKIVAAELRSDPELRSADPRKGYIHLRNNRRSADPGVAVVMRTPGPVLYRETPEAGGPHVQTDAVIEITDLQNAPKPNPGEAVALMPTVTATGMRLFLAIEPDGKATPAPADKAAVAKADPKKSPARKNPGGVAGVQRVEMNANVTMNLWVEPGTSFPAGSPKAKPAPPKPNAPPQERALIQIHTDGPFRYDVEPDLARFDLAPHADPSIPNYVQVTRQTKSGRDMLTCDHLEMHFLRRKPGAGPKGPKPPPAPVTAGGPDAKVDQPKPEVDMDIDTVHAWGKTIVLSSDAEDLTAWGNDLVHDAPKKETILKGEPLIAVKEGNQVRAREMVLVGGDDRGAQQARVKGPGQIDLGQLDPATKKHAYTRQAVWQDWLVFSRVREQGKDLDVLTLTGGARFADVANDQMLQARQLKVWLLPKDEKKADPKAPPKGGGNIQARPHRLEATGQVVAHSPELDVQRADYLNVWFRDVRPGTPAPGKAGSPLIPAKGNPAPPAGPPAKAAAEAPKAKAPPPPAAKRRPPIKITAKRIETWVVVTDGKNDLERAHCEEEVAVHQDPTNPGERGVDIAGHAVGLEHFADGNILTVAGSVEKTGGEVHFDKLSLIADDILVNQRDNTAGVKGAGSMRMLSKASLQGDPLSKPTFITVHWKDGMEFRGTDRWARFEGRVQAQQENSRVLCETMQVTLDREVFLNQALRPRDLPGPKDEKGPKGEKGDSSPKVEFIVCDQEPREVAGRPKAEPQPVSYTDELRKDGAIVRSQQIEARQLNLDNLRGDVVAPGPGTVRVFQPGSKDPFGDEKGGDAKGKVAKPDPKAGQEMKLTVVTYGTRMKANHKTKTATFYDSIQVVHMAADRPDMKVDPVRLPPGALRMECDTSLEVGTTRRVGPDGKERAYQNLTGRGNVRVKSDDFSGTAQEIKYDEEKETVIFQGTPQNQAVLYKVDAPGQEPKRIRGVKITYNRRTRNIDVDQASGVQAN